MLKNTQYGYGWIAIFLHWLVAIAVFGLFGLGLYMVDLSYYDSWYKGSLDLHKSIGITLALVFALRLVWRITQVTPHAADPTLVWQNRLAHIAHGLLYVLLAVLLMTGYLISTADGRGIEVFSLFTVPSMGEFIDNQEDIAGLIHEYVAWSLIIFAALHALAALKHHFINRDRTLTRMLKATKGDNHE
ncbi:cytochrome b [Pseudoalteromonas sp. CNC9-20]|uniref:cytochrome b n=1 Tax=Pseudoalteromonas sp. CNC9-20 TaxID=2917750 RepID=UPI001EF3EB3B|nr:cytochrome b [Pseudoalteromonas sp. CNC9-20]MCG7568990.1 cytochrome b [Pseudoalteromonas sp. CNC9-20]